MQMRKIPQMTVHSNEEVVLEPAGRHIIVIGLKESLFTGEQIELTLNCDDGSNHTLNVEIKDVMAAMGEKHRH
jgi:copper(I)-binding protein